MANQAAPRRATNVASRSRDRRQPYAKWTDTNTGWKVYLLKSYQVNNGTPHARWFTWVESDFSEYGDQYARELFSGLQWATDLEFDTSIWENKTRFIEWAQGTG